MQVALLDNDVTEDHIIVLISMEPLHDMLDVRHTRVRLPAEAGASSAADGTDGTPELTPVEELEGLAMRMLHREHQLRFMEQFLKLGAAAAGGSVPPPPQTQLHKSLRLELAHRAISRVLDAVTFELGNSPDFEGQTAWDFVDMCFPLHDARWNKRFLKRFGGSLLDPRNWVPDSVRTCLARRNGELPEDEIDSTYEGSSDESDSDEDTSRRSRGRKSSRAPTALRGGGAARASAGAAVATPPTGAGVVATRPRTARSVGSQFSDTDSESDDEAPTGQAADDGWLGGYSTAWAVQEIRDHMGERAAFYFAFLQHYTGWLTLMGVVLAIWFLGMRWASWFGYQRGLMWLGWAVPALWAPLMLRTWQQRSSVWEERWGVNNMPLEDHENTNASFLFEEADAATGELRRRYDPTNNRLKILLATLPAYALNVAAMLVTVAPFLQWYVFVRMAPTCECCEWHMAVGTQNRNSSVVPALPAACVYLQPTITEALTAPVQCNPVVNCFASEATDIFSDRGAYLFVIGASMGIVLQIFQFEVFVRVGRWVTEREHWPTEEQHERHLYNRMFVLMYLNVMFVFVLLAFVYGPLGAQVQLALLDSGLNALVPMYGWVDGQLSVDEFVAAPIVFCQLANLLLETVVPMYAVRHTPGLPRVDVVPSAKGAELQHLALLRRDERGANGAADAHETGAGGAESPSPAQQRGSGAHEQDAAKVVAARGLPGAIATPSPAPAESKRAPVPAGVAPASLASGGGAAAPMLQDWDEDDDDEDEDDDEDTVELKPKRKHEPTHLLARRLWERARTPVVVLDFIDDPCHYEARDVLEQANLPEFEPGAEYLDMVKQFVLVASMAVVWAWAPLSAAINNNIEMRADAVKMVRAQKRPIPRRDEGIGEWERIFLKATYAALPLACGFIALATGQIEFWMFGADCHADRLGDRMVADYDCTPDWTWRLVWFVVLERVGMSVVGLVQRIPDEPKWLREKHERAAARSRAAAQEKLVFQLPSGMRENLEFLFRSFDADGNGNLSRQELADMLDVMLPGPLPSSHMRILLTLVDVDATSTTTFGEFAYALRQCASDAVLKEAIDMEQLAAAAQRLAVGVRDGSVATDGVFGTDGKGRLTIAEQRRNFELVREYLHGE